jgi:hypothetical protein
LNGSQALAPTAQSGEATAIASDATTATQGADYISSRSAGKHQLMNKTTYNREMKQKQGQRDDSDAIRKAALDAAVPVSQVGQSSLQNRHELTISGLQFRMADDGSKLYRVSGETARGAKPERMLKTRVSDDPQKTPKTAKIADVIFIRTKRGNLVRANASKSNPRYNHARDSVVGLGPMLTAHRLTTARRKAQCEHFTKFGTLHLIHQTPDLLAAKISTIRPAYCESVSIDPIH